MVTGPLSQGPSRAAGLRMDDGKPRLELDHAEWVPRPDIVLAFAQFRELRVQVCKTVGFAYPLSRC
jgi:hypothetical protein